MNNMFNQTKRFMNDHKAESDSLTGGIVVMAIGMIVFFVAMVIAVA